MTEATKERLKDPDVYEFYRKIRAQTTVLSDEQILAVYDKKQSLSFFSSTTVADLVQEQIDLARTSGGEKDVAANEQDIVPLLADTKTIERLGVPSAPTGSTADTKTDEEKAADERLEAQCMLIDYLPQLASQNYSWRGNPKNSGVEKNQANGGGGYSNPFMTGMWGDGEQFSSNVHGSQLKSKFLDFTTPQLSSLVPLIKFYKIQQTSQGQTKDYVIPFSTHAGWIGDKSVSINEKSWKLDSTLNYKTTEIDVNTPINVGIKSFNWEFQGTNPVSTKADIKAELTISAKSLVDLISPFNIPATDGSEQHLFKYVDMILRSGKKFNEGKQYNPDYYRIKAEIGWKTGNTDLFTTDELRCLDANTSILILTLIDHEFVFDEDGSVQLKMSYRAYFESLFAQDDADFLRSVQDATDVAQLRQKMQDLKKELQPEDDEAQPDTSKQKQYDELGKQYDQMIDDLNKRSFQRIIDSLSSLNAIYYAQVDVALYNTSKQNKEETIQGLILNPPTTEASTNTANKIKEAVTTNLDSKGNPNINKLVPVQQGGKRNLSFFYLGDLIYIALYEVNQKTGFNVSLPYFLFGSALYKKSNDSSVLEYVNILDIPVSIEWFSEWFTSTIIAQDKETYQILYFIRDLCSKLVTNLMSSACDKTGSLKYRNRLNTANFVLKKEDNKNVVVTTRAVGWNAQGFRDDLDVNPTLSNLIQQYTPLISEQTPYSQLQEYVAIYCQDRISPKKVDFCQDMERGIYHFYFGKDRGLVKTIKFNRTQVVGLRELNYARESNGLGLEQLMTPYEVEITMVGNNLMYNGMMVMIDPSGFGRRIGQTDDPQSISYQLKLGGYHMVHNVKNSLTTDGFVTTVKARWIGSGRSGPIGVSDGEDTGTIYGATQPLTRSDNPPIVPPQNTSSNLATVTDTANNTSYTPSTDEAVENVYINTASSRRR